MGAKPPRRNSRAFWKATSEELPQYEIRAEVSHSWHWVLVHFHWGMSVACMSGYGRLVVVVVVGDDGGMPFSESGEVVEDVV